MSTYNHKFHKVVLLNLIIFLLFSLTSCQTDSSQSTTKTSSTAPESSVLLSDAVASSAATQKTTIPVTENTTGISGMSEEELQTFQKAWANQIRYTFNNSLLNYAMFTQPGTYIIYADTKKIYCSDGLITKDNMDTIKRSDVTNTFSEYKQEKLFSLMEEYQTAKILLYFKNYSKNNSLGWCFHKDSRVKYPADFGDTNWDILSSEEDYWASIRSVWNDRVTAVFYDYLYKDSFFPEDGSYLIYRDRKKIYIADEYVTEETMEKVKKTDVTSKIPKEKREELFLKMNENFVSKIFVRCWKGENVSAVAFIDAPKVESIAYYDHFIDIFTMPKESQ